MLKRSQAALMAAFVLAGCGGGGGGDAAPSPPPPPGPIAAAEALRLAAKASLDVTTLAWSLSSSIQNTLVSAPSQVAATQVCGQGGRVIATRPSTTLLRLEYDNCRTGSVDFGGIVEASDALVTVDAAATNWSGSVRWVSFSLVGTTGDGRAEIASFSATGSGSVRGSVQPLSLRITGLTARRAPSALGLNATLTSAALNVERLGTSSGVYRDLYALDGCVALTSGGTAAELCIDAGSRIALLENVGTEQFTGRLRWNAGTPGGFDARLRITPAGAAGSTALRVELDLDANGSFEAVATLDRTTDIGLRL